MFPRAMKLVASQIIFVLVLLVLLVGAHLVPDDRIADQLVDAQAKGEFSQENWILTRPANLQDKYADCFGAAQGLGNDSALSSALRSPTLGPCTDANPRLVSYAATGSLEPSFEYYRYWHGYTVLTRPALAVLGLAGTRYLLTFLIVAAVAAVGYLATIRTRHLAASLLLLPLVASTDLLWMASSIPTAVGVIGALAGPVLVMSGPKLTMDPDPDSEVRVMARVMIAGGLVAFTDLLSVTGIGWPLTVLAVVLMLANHDVTDRHSAKITAGAALAWMIGYGTTWAAKWLLAGLDVGLGTVWTNVRSRVEFRVDGEHQLVENGITETSRANFDYWLDQPYAAQVLLLTAVVVAGSVYMQRDQLRAWAQRFALLASPALLVIIWYEVVRNHNQIHRWLAYRFWAVFFGIVIFAALQATNLVTPSDELADSPRDDEMVEN